MKRPATCPISRDRVDHNANRVTCVFTIIALVPIPFIAAGSGGLTAAAQILAVGVAVDYAIRAWAPFLSPMQRVACRVARAVGVPKKPSDGAPQRFAYQMGFFLAAAIPVLLALAPAAAAVLSANLLFFNALDGVFDFCVGCWIYSTFLGQSSTAS